MSRPATLAQATSSTAIARTLIMAINSASGGDCWILASSSVRTAKIEASAAAFKNCQQQAFEAERERWAKAGADQFTESAPEAPSQSEPAMPEGCRAVRSPTTASVWKVSVEPGQRVAAGERLVVLEAMKMEIAVAAPIAGIIEKLNCAKGALVMAGQNLVTLRQEVLV